MKCSQDSSLLPWMSLKHLPFIPPSRTSFDKCHLSMLKNLTYFDDKLPIVEYQVQRSSTRYVTLYYNVFLENPSFNDTLDNIKETVSIPLVSRPTRPY